MTERSGQPYGAFLSYNHKDAEIAAWFQSRLERFRAPRALVRGFGDGEAPSRAIGRVYRDSTDFAAGGRLDDSIRKALDVSSRLVVLCSDASAQSQYVNKEIEYFIGLGRSDAIYPVIVGGEPPSCFPPALLALGEPIAADAREQRRQTAFQKLIAGMLGVGHDDLIQRLAVAQRWKIRAAIGMAAAFALIGMVAVWFAFAAQRSAQLARTNEARALDSERVAVRERNYAKVAQLDAEAQKRIAERERDQAVLARQREVAQRERADMEKRAANEQRRIAEIQRDQANYNQIQAQLALARVNVSKGDWLGTAEVARQVLGTSFANASQRRSAEGILAEAEHNDLRLLTFHMPIPPEDTPPEGYRFNVVIEPSGRYVLLSGNSTSIIDLEANQISHRFPKLNFDGSAYFDPKGMSFVLPSYPKSRCITLFTYQVSECEGRLFKTYDDYVSTGESYSIDIGSGKKSTISAARGARQIWFNLKKTYALTQSFNGLAVLWKLDSPEAKAVMRISNTAQRGSFEAPFAFDDQDQMFAISPVAGEIIVSDLTTGATKTIVDRFQYLEALAINSRTHKVVAIDEALNVRTWRVEAKNARWARKFADKVRLAAFDPKNDVVAVVDEKNTVHAYRIASEAEISSFSFQPHIRSMGIAGNIIVLGHANGAVSFIDLKLAKVTRLDNAHADTVQAIAFSADGTRVATGGSDDRINVYDSATQKTICAIRADSGTTVLTFPDAANARLVAADAERILAWNIEKCEKVFIENGNSSTVVSQMVFDRTGQMIANDQGEIKFGLRGSRMQLIGVKLPQSAAAISLASGGMIVGRDGLLRLLDLKQHSIVAELHLLVAPILGAAISREGKEILYWDEGRVMIEEVEMPNTTGTPASSGAISVKGRE